MAPHPRIGLDGIIVWNPGHKILLTEAMALFWSEHSDRAVLTSLAACAGCSHPAGQAIGRWKAGSSDEYVRTALALVREAQILVASTIRASYGRTDIFGETELLGRLQKFLTDRGVPGPSSLSQTGELKDFKPSFARDDEEWR